MPLRIYFLESHQPDGGGYPQTPSFVMKPMLRFVPLLLVLGVLSAVLTLPVAGQSPEKYALYMPVAGRTMATGPVFTILAGRMPPTDLILTLDFFDGVTTTEYMSATRGAAGWFIFDKLPLLEPGQYYQVSYYNGRYGPVDESRNTIAKGPRITASVAGSAVSGNPIYDGGNLIRLTSPSDGRQYAIRHPLQWAPLTEHFYITIYDLQGNKLYETEPRQSSEAYFSPLPPALAFDTPYSWQVSIRNPDGSEVINNRARREVTFVEHDPLPSPAALSSYCEDFGERITRCHFQWDALGENAEYHFEWSYGPVRQEQRQFLDPLNPEWGTGTTISLELYCGPTYKWRVKGRTESAESDWSEWAAVITQYCPPLPSHP